MIEDVPQALLEAAQKAEQNLGDASEKEIMQAIPNVAVRQIV